MSRIIKITTWNFQSLILLIFIWHLCQRNWNLEKWLKAEINHIFDDRWSNISPFRALISLAGRGTWHNGKYLLTPSGPGFGSRVFSCNCWGLLTASWQRLDNVHPTLLLLASCQLQLVFQATFSYYLPNHNHLAKIGISNHQHLLLTS